MGIDWESEVVNPCLDVFGESNDDIITYRPVDGAPFTIVGVFDEAYHELTMVDAGVPTNTAVPVLGVSQSQFVNPPVQGDQVDIPKTSSRYVVSDVQPDGHGAIKLLLQYEADL